MTNFTTEARLTISTDGTSGPYVMVTPEQLGLLTSVLRAQGLPFHIDEDAVLLSWTPALAVINFGPGADVAKVQQVLDGITDDLEGKGNRRHRSPSQKELIVRGDTRSMQQLRRRLDEEVKADWTRRTDVEERFRKTLPQRTSAYCFSKRVPTVGRPVAVLLRGRGPQDGEELYLSGVIPLEGREPLDADQHDQVVTDFRETFIGPLASGLNVRLLDCCSPIQPSLEETLSLEARNRLQSFSAAANKSLLHPLDLRRWDSFIAQTHFDDRVVDTVLLGEWLAEEGFPQELRDQLISQYESGHRLLSVYDEDRR